VRPLHGPGLKVELKYEERSLRGTADRTSGWRSAPRALRRKTGPARDFEYALELANHTQYVLTGEVFSNNAEHLREAKERFHLGTLYFNRKCTGAMVEVHSFAGFNMSVTDSRRAGRIICFCFCRRSRWD